MTSMPVIAIVGRPNVGKSSLLNALVGKRIAIVQDVPGVTRDRVSMHLQLDGRYVELVDTGGYGFIDPDQLTDHIRQQIELAMGRADLVLFVVDCQTGLTAADQEVAGILRRRGLKTILVANKADGTRVDAMLGDFGRIGLGTPLGVSAMNGRNLEDLVATIRRNIDLSSAPTEIPEPEMMIAIVGKRNAGKSTLVNTIAGIYEGDANRVIVSEVPGTTRDSIDVRVERDGNALIVIDTAGVRKKRHMVTNDIEFYSFHRAQRSVRRADVVLLLIDSTEPVSEPDKKLAQYIAEQFKPVVLVINKWDLARKTLREQSEAQGQPADERRLMTKYREYLNAELRHLDFAPVAFISAKAGENVESIISISRRLFNQGRQRITTSKLNQAVRQIIQERSPSTHSGRRAKIYYATQIQLAPPTIALVVNEPMIFDDTYLRFILNRLRQLLPYPEVPVRLLVRRRGPGGQAKPLDDQTIEEIDELSEDLPVPPETPMLKTAPKPSASPSKKPAPKPKPKRPEFRKKVSRPQPKPHPKGAPRHGGGRAGKRSR